MDIIWVFTETCACKKHFKIQSTRGTTYSWFLTTGGDPDPCPVTTIGGASGSKFPSICIISAPCVRNPSYLSSTFQDMISRSILRRLREKPGQ